MNKFKIIMSIILGLFALFFFGIAPIIGGVIYAYYAYMELKQELANYGLPFEITVIIVTVITIIIVAIVKILKRRKRKEVKFRRRGELTFDKSDLY